MSADLPPQPKVSPKPDDKPGNRAERRRSLREAYKLAHQPKEDIKTSNREAGPDTEPALIIKQLTPSVISAPVAAIPSGIASVSKSVGDPWYYSGLFLFLAAVVLTAIITYVSVRYDPRWILVAVWPFATWMWVIFVRHAWSEQCKSTKNILGSIVIAIGLIALIGGSPTDSRPAWWPEFTALVKPTSPNAALPFLIKERASFVNMSRDIFHGLPWWLSYPAGKGTTWYSPIAVMVWVDLTNNADIPKTIESYSVAIHTGACGWTYLVPIPIKGMQFYFLGNGIDKARRTDFSTNSFLPAIQKPLTAHATVSGWLLFDSHERCQVVDGDTIRWKFSLKIFGENDFEQESENEIVANRDLATHKTEQFTSGPNWTIIGPPFNLGSTLHVRFYSDPAPTE